MLSVDWPWQYSFPPFFTLQPYGETRARQIKIWSNLVLDYCRANRQCYIDIHEATKSPLFNNAAINRKLNPEFIVAILSDLQRTQHANPLDKHKIEWEVYWHTLDEFATLIYAHVRNKGATDSVLTIFELSQGEDAENEPFFSLHEEIIVKSLKVLERRNLCELMSFEEQKGVKFFK